MTMSRDQRILGLYESIGRVSRTMAAAAERADWESLEAGERVCGLLIEHVEALGDPASQLDPSGRRRRLAILRDVLEDDAAIRRHTEPGVARLASLLSPRTSGRGG